MNIGSRIKRIREEFGISVDQLAERIGKDRATVYRYENGEIDNIPSNLIEPIATCLKVTSTYLMGWSEQLRIEINFSTGKAYMSELHKKQVPVEIGCMVVGSRVFEDDEENPGWKTSWPIFISNDQLTETSE